MAAYRRVYDSRHLQADCQEPDQFRNPTLGNWVWATFTFTVLQAGQAGGCTAFVSALKPRLAYEL